MSCWISKYRALDPLACRLLVCAIIELGVNDWRTHGHTDRPSKYEQRKIVKTAREVGYEAPRQELIAFFHSEWGDTLCNHAGVNVLGAVRELGIPNQKGGS